MHYFSQESFTYGDRTWTSHNNLLEDYEGTTGLKTGYTRASGFNLIATVERGEVSLIGIVMGGRSAARRDREMVRILDLNFARLRENPYFGARIFASTARPALRPRDGEYERAPAEPAMAAVAPSAMPEPRPQILTSDELASLETPEINPILDPQRYSGEPDNDLVALLDQGTGLNPENMDGRNNPQRVGGAISLRENSSETSSGDIDPSANNLIFLGGSHHPQGWGIDVGEFSEPQLADESLRRTAAAVPTRLTWGLAAIFPAQGDGEVSFGAGFGPMAEDEAVAACASLAQQGFDCQPVDRVDWDQAVRR